MKTNAPEDRPSARDICMRGLFMLLMLIAFWVAETLLILLALVQFFWLLFAREPNQSLARFGNSLSTWLWQIGRFLGCASEQKPFPWAPWPEAGIGPSA